MRTLLVCLALSLCSLAAAGQTPSSAVEPVCLELAKISTSMREIASLLSAQRDLGTLDLLLKRVQVEESRLGRATDRLRVIASERRVLETAKAPVEAKLEVLAAQLDQISAGPHPELEVMSAQLQEELRRIRLGLAGLAEEASVLENEVGRRREELAVWQNLVDRRLRE